MQDDHLVGISTSLFVDLGTGSARRMKHGYDGGERLDMRKTAGLLLCSVEHGQHCQRARREQSEVSPGQNETNSSLRLWS
jgi:hypothetical protein